MHNAEARVVVEMPQSTVAMACARHRFALFLCVRREGTADAREIAAIKPMPAILSLSEADRLAQSRLDQAIAHREFDLPRYIFPLEASD